MAKTATPETENSAEFDVQFDTYVPEAPAGKFDGHVQAMLDRDTLLEREHPDAYAKGERTRAKILTTEEDIQKVTRQFQDSARKFDRTARNVGAVPQGDGGVLLQFVLGVRQTRPRKAKSTVEGETETAAAE